MAGTVGLPGRRTFFLQASTGPRVTSVSLEKTQVAALAERMEELLDEVVRRTGGNAPVPAVAPAEATDTAPSTSPSRRSSASAPWPWPGTARTSA